MNLACRRLATALTLLVFGLLIWLVGSHPTPEAEAQQAAPPRRPAGRAVAMPAHTVALEINLGLKDRQAADWDGDVQVSEGRVVSMQVLRGGPRAKVEGNRFFSRVTQNAKKKKQAAAARPKLQVTLEAPLTATVTVKTGQGTAKILLKDLAIGTAKPALDGRISVERLEGSVRLTDTELEEDYPALARAADGTVWLAYVEYQPGKALVRERVLAGNFDELVPTGHGDRIRLVRFDGQNWQPALDVTDGGLDVHRPTVAVDGKGNVVVAWGQRLQDDWEIYYRRFTPAGGGGEGQWSDVVRVSENPGSDFHVVAATDSAGVVWLAWQSWRQDNFDIALAALADGHAWKKPRVISKSKANDWSPAIAADKRGNVHVAWDTYDRGDRNAYDVLLHTVGPDHGAGQATTVADSPRFEARVNLLCDAQDRLWIAYEEGDEQWGKDFATLEYQKVPLPRNPGNALYLQRTIKVKCLADGKLLQPAADLEQAFAGRPKQNKSLPRLGADSAGGLWLLLRHHPLATGVGEVWDSYALRYDGKTWSAPRHLANSSNLMDNRPGVVGFASGIVTVFSSDARINTQQRKQDDLYAAILYPEGATQAPELAAVPSVAAVPLPVVHPNEAEDIARMRGYRVDHNGKQLHLLRGEFHRHTEYSAHRDQDGSMEDAYRYGLDAGHLDWYNVGDHDNGHHHEYHWWQMQKATDLYHNAPNFVTLFGYERSVVYPNGHRNVIMARRGVRPLIRGGLPGTEAKGSADTKLLYAYLKHFNAMCASHTSGTNMGTDWRDNDPVFEPVVEIYQGHRHNYERPDAPRANSADNQIGGFQPKGYVRNALEKGYRFGFQSSSDHMSTHISYGIVLAEGVSRQAVIDAFKKRHSYAATDNILLDVRSGDHLMGDAFETDKRPTLEISVRGTAPVAKVHVIRDNAYVYSTEPKQAEVKLRYTDMAATQGKTSFYYVRVEQADGNLAWASPMWITYR